MVQGNLTYRSSRKQSIRKQSVGKQGGDSQRRNSTQAETAESEYRPINRQVLRDVGKAFALNVASGGGALGKAAAQDMAAAPVNLTRTLANTAALPRLGQPGIIGADHTTTGCGFLAVCRALPGVRSLFRQRHDGPPDDEDVFGLVGGDPPQGMPVTRDGTQTGVKSAVHRSTEQSELSTDPAIRRTYRMSAVTPTTPRRAPDVAAAASGNLTRLRGAPKLALGAPSAASARL
ncbi:hypothetical protein BV898_05852 [Hypsibius exemplaris]|uniref:Uncharacterized protein n=1 Tax=Hypsibius exemplaris TaxID=2072580 RepID=A0A1W0WXX4_HYPEX|nr:hypothetical protein BV898_05852 [Hypsibius exemplaris]